MLRIYCCFFIMLTAFSAFAQTDSIPDKNKNPKRIAKLEKTKGNPEKIKKNKATSRDVEEALTGVKTNGSREKEPSTTTKSTADNTENCNLAYNIVDEFSGKRKKALNTRWFFGFTPEPYKKFFPNHDYLECYGYLMESDGQLALHLTISIEDKNAKSQFGTIEAGAQVFIRPIKNNTLALTSYKGATVMEDSEKTVYECSFALDKSALKILKKDEIDTIRIVWSKGYQTYEVYYLDFLRDQILCFEGM